MVSGVVSKQCTDGEHWMIWVVGLVGTSCCLRRTCSEPCVKHQRVNKRERFDLNNKVGSSYWTEVPGDGPTLRSTV